MPGIIDLAKIREYVKFHITSHGMEETEDFLVQLFANKPSNPYDFAKAYFKDPEEKKKAQLVSGVLTNYIKKSKKIPEDDLRNLRQATNDFYQELNPTYWDVVGRCIKVITTYKSRTDSAGCFKKMLILDRDLKQTYWEFSPKVWPRQVKHQIHTFRTLILEEDKPTLRMYRCPISDVNWTDLITPINPYLTQLEFNSRIGNWHCLNAEEIVKIIKLFTNLKKVKINNASAYPDQSEIVLRSLNPSIQVVAVVYSDYKDVFDRCEDIPNISWIVIVYTDLLETLTIFRHRSNLDVTFKFYQQRPTDLDTLKRTTELCLEFQDKITELELKLSDDIFENQDETTVKNCLRDLSSFVTELELTFGLHNWNIPDGAWFWPKLSKLQISFDIEDSKGNIPLAIKNSSSNLKYLDLYGDDQDLSIFSDPEKSEEVAIRDFFAPLTQLEHLKLMKDRIKEGNQLEGILKLMLPKLKKIEYRRKLTDN